MAKAVSLADLTPARMSSLRQCCDCLPVGARRCGRRVRARPAARTTSSPGRPCYWSVA